MSEERVVRGSLVPSSSQFDPFLTDEDESQISRDPFSVSDFGSIYTDNHPGEHVKHDPDFIDEEEYSYGDEDGSKQWSRDDDPPSTSAREQYRRDSTTSRSHPIHELDEDDEDEAELRALGASLPTPDPQRTSLSGSASQHERDASNTSGESSRMGRSGRAESSHRDPLKPVFGDNNNVSASAHTAPGDGSFGGSFNSSMEGTPNVRGGVGLGSKSFSHARPLTGSRTDPRLNMTEMYVPRGRGHMRQASDSSEVTRLKFEIESLKMRLSEQESRLKGQELRENILKQQVSTRNKDREKLADRGKKVKELEEAIADTRRQLSRYKDTWEPRVESLRDEVVMLQNQNAALTKKVEEGEKATHMAQLAAASLKEEKQILEDARNEQMRELVGLRRTADAAREAEHALSLHRAMLEKAEAANLRKTKEVDELRAALDEAQTQVKVLKATVDATSGTSSPRAETRGEPDSELARLRADVGRLTRQLEEGVSSPRDDSAAQLYVELLDLEKAKRDAAEGRLADARVEITRLQGLLDQKGMMTLPTPSSAHDDDYEKLAARVNDLQRQLVEERTLRSIAEKKLAGLEKKEAETREALGAETRSAYEAEARRNGRETVLREELTAARQQIEALRSAVQGSEANEKVLQEQVRAKEHALHDRDNRIERLSLQISGHQEREEELRNHNVKWEHSNELLRRHLEEAGERAAKLMAENDRLAKKLKTAEQDLVFLYGAYGSGSPRSRTTTSVFMNRARRGSSVSGANGPTGGTGFDEDDDETVNPEGSLPDEAHSDGEVERRIRRGSMLSVPSDTKGNEASSSVPSSPRRSRAPIKKMPLFMQDMTEELQSDSVVPVPRPKGRSFHSRNASMPVAPLSSHSSMQSFGSPSVVGHSGSPDAQQLIIGDSSGSGILAVLEQGPRRMEMKTLDLDHKVPAAVEVKRKLRKPVAASTSADTKAIHDKLDALMQRLSELEKKGAALVLSEEGVTVSNTLLQDVSYIKESLHVEVGHPSVAEEVHRTATTLSDIQLQLQGMELTLDAINEGQTPVKEGVAQLVEATRGLQGFTVSSLTNDDDIKKKLDEIVLSFSSLSLSAGNGDPKAVEAAMQGMVAQIKDHMDSKLQGLDGETKEQEAILRSISDQVTSLLGPEANDALLGEVRRVVEEVASQFMSLDSRDIGPALAQLEALQAEMKAALESAPPSRSPSFGDSLNLAALEPLPPNEPRDNGPSNAIIWFWSIGVLAIAFMSTFNPCGEDCVDAIIGEFIPT